MAISVGDKLPDGVLMRMGDEGPEKVNMSELTTGRKIAILAVPGPFSGTCHIKHLPSFIETKPELEAKGVEEIVCLSVIDPFVMKAWGEATGATAAGISLWTDASGEFTKAIGMDFDAPVVGFYGRSLRYSMLVEDGVVTQLHLEEGPGKFGNTSGQTMLAAM